jgi:hypothetical protein
VTSPRAHTLQGRLATEGPVGPLDPLVGHVRLGIEEFERFMDAGHVANAPQGIHGDADCVAGAPDIEGALGRCAEEGAGIVGAQTPGMHDSEEPAQGRGGVDRLR